MSEIMCMNHPEWPVDETGEDFGPPLCTECAASYHLPPAETSTESDDDGGQQRGEVNWLALGLHGPEMGSIWPDFYQDLQPFEAEDGPW